MMNSIRLPKDLEDEFLASGIVDDLKDICSKITEFNRAVLNERGFHLSYSVDVYASEFTGDTITEVGRTWTDDNKH